MRTLLRLAVTQKERKMECTVKYFGGSTGYCVLRHRERIISCTNGVHCIDGFVLCVSLAEKYTRIFLGFWIIQSQWDSARLSGHRKKVLH